MAALATSTSADRQHGDGDIARQRDCGYDGHHNRREERHDRSDARPQ